MTSADDDAHARWRAAFPWPAPDAHKHERGRLGVVSGTVLRTGAARLAARAGLRIGAGLVRILCPPDAALVIAGAVEAVMVDEFSSAEALSRLADPLDTVASVRPAAGPMTTVSRGSARRDDVLTPHEGEFERLFPGLLSHGREAAARRAAAEAGCVVVLKGRETVIAAPDGRLSVNDNGSPWLATAGSGDVLAGMIGGLIAQRMDSFDAACAAVWLHADAGARIGPGLIAEDLPEMLPTVLAALHAATRPDSSWRVGRSER